MQAISTPAYVALLIISIAFIAISFTFLADLFLLRLLFSLLGGLLLGHSAAMVVIRHLEKRDAL